MIPFVVLIALIGLYLFLSVKTKASYCKGCGKCKE